MKNATHILLTVSALSALTVPALGQAPQPVSPPPSTAALDLDSDAARLTFEPVFFEDFNPQTALDLVRRVPGFSLDGGGGGRGLAGALGNVLIDGRRPSSKAGVTTLLQRLPAATVLRVELIRAPLPGIDMAGQDQVVNILTDRSGGWTGAWRGDAALFESGRVVPRGDVSATRTSPNATLTLAVNLEGHANGQDTVRQRFAPSGETRTILQDRAQERFWDLTPSVAYQRQFDAGHSLRVDARVWTWGFANNRFTQARDGLDLLTGTEDSRREVDAYGGEISADYNHALTDIWSVKLTGLQRLSVEDELETVEAFDGRGAFDERIRITENEEEGETVLRLETRRAASDARSTTFILETAYNFLEGDFDLFEDDGDEDGEQEIVVPVSDTRVEEQRTNLGVTHLWRLNPQWTLDATAAVELSTISQSGDAEQERSFTYFKPEATLTWTPRPQDQLRFSLRRSVGQLSFGDFISSVDVVDGLEDLGNPDLEPERTTAAQIEWERRFWADGVLTVILRHEWVEGVSDVVPVGRFGDAPGNLGDGERTWVQFETEIPTDRLGVSGGLLTLSGRLRDTQVTDPVTGDERRFRGDEDWRAGVDFRQDLPDRGFAWGFDYYVQGDEDFYRRREFARTSAARGGLDLFAEQQLPRGLTARVGTDLNLGEAGRERYRWAVSRAIGQPIERERRDRNRDGFAYFELRGIF